MKVPSLLNINKRSPIGRRVVERPVYSIEQRATIRRTRRHAIAAVGLLVGLLALVPNADAKPPSPRDDSHFRWLKTRPDCAYCERSWEPRTIRQEEILLAAEFEAAQLADQEGAWGAAVLDCERWSRRRWQCRSVGYFEATVETHGFEGVARCPLPITVRVGPRGWVSGLGWWAGDCSPYQPMTPRVFKG